MALVAWRWARSSRRFVVWSGGWAGTANAMIDEANSNGVSAGEQLGLRPLEGDPPKPGRKGGCQGVGPLT